MSGGLTVNDDVRPANGTFAVQDIYVRGGFRVVDNTSDINAIPTGNSNLRIGQRVYVVNTGIEYQLTSLTHGGGFTNGTWAVVSYPSSGAWAGVDTIADTNISLSGGGTIHNVVLADGMRVLPTAQSTPSQNGIWVVATGGAWTRATDADSAGEFSIGKLVSVTNPSSDEYGTIWTCTSSVSTLGTDPITFTVNTTGSAVVDWTRPGTIGSNVANSAEITQLLLHSFITWLSGNSQFVGVKGPAFLSDGPFTVASNLYNAPILRVISSVSLTAKWKMTLPLNAGPWLIYNGTTGGQAITVGGATGTGVDIPNGGMALVSSPDVTNFYGVSGGGGGGDTTDATTHTANFTCDATDAIVLYDTSGGAFTATLPASPTRGMKRVLKDDGLAIDTNALTVSSGSSAKVQNPATGSKSATSVDLGTATGLNNGASVAFLFNGTDWVVL